MHNGDGGIRKRETMRDGKIWFICLIIEGGIWLPHLYYIGIAIQSWRREPAGKSGKYSQCTFAVPHVRGPDFTSEMSQSIEWKEKGSLRLDTMRLMELDGKLAMNWSTYLTLPTRILAIGKQWVVEFNVAGHRKMSPPVVCLLMTRTTSRDIGIDL
ncbi:hypothetical protein F5146DRAFT_1006813 [Armillaria mellea]|nr:hypothetical protein F5146DRAFT_1006813 [Armillaria mellea]